MAEGPSPRDAVIKQRRMALWKEIEAAKEQATVDVLSRQCYQTEVEYIGTEYGAAITQVVAKTCPLGRDCRCDHCPYYITHDKQRTTIFCMKKTTYDNII